MSVEGDTDQALIAALGRIGDRSGETWLHLLGLCLDLAPPAPLDQLIEHIATMDAMDFRRVLLGSTAWSWRSIVGAETIEAAASGDEDAASRLLSDDRYYGRSALASLATILPLDAEETKQRFLSTLEAYRDAHDVENLAGPLAGTARDLDSLATQEGWVEALEQVTDYRYMPEPEARRVVVMPHLARPGLVLAQHNDTRLIVYGATPPPTAMDHIVEIGKALSDRSRVEILHALAKRPLHLGELVEQVELTRSTVHHHLRLLRSVGLVSMSGNARAYQYQISERGRSQALHAIDGLLKADGSQRSVS
jgi:DNA-binding transcriptional ArsR family regulator